MFNNIVIAPMYLVDNSTSDLEATYHFSCACDETGDELFVHMHSYSENDVCSECGYVCKDIHLFTISNTTLTGLAVEKSEVIGAISIPKGIKSICSSVFSNCTNLTGIILPSSVTSIGSNLFKGCTSLKDITIPFVGDGSTNSFFGYLFGLSRYSKIPSSVTKVTITGGDTIDEDAFYGCDKLTSISIPNSVTNIGKNAFYCCKGLTSISIPNSVTIIDDYAFYGCDKLTSISIPDSVTHIGKFAFYSCTGLTSITMFSSVTNIGQRAFAECRNITCLSFKGFVDQWNSIEKGNEWGTYIRSIQCSDGAIVRDYIVGDIGPAGGYIIYDCDADNDSGNADGMISTNVGWRYLEAAPADLRLVNGVPSVDSMLEGYSSGICNFSFGYYRITANSKDELYVNGTTTYNAADCTTLEVGTGKRNTLRLINAMGNEAYKYYHTNSNNSEKTADYAAKLCWNLTYNGFSDWFLPSVLELRLMYNLLKTNGLGGFADDRYWSSSEGQGTNSGHLVCQIGFSDGGSGDYGRKDAFRVRPLRAF